MKKHFTKILSVILIMLTLLTFTACDLVDEGTFTDPIESDNTEADYTLSGNNQLSNIPDSVENIEIAAKPAESIVFYKTIPADIITQVGEAITDGTYNYFYFKIGETKNVPVFSDTATRHNGTTTTVYEWKTVSSTEDSYTNSTTDSIKNSTKHSMGVELKTTAESKVSAKYGYDGFTASAGVSVTAGLNASISHEHTEEFKQTFSQTVSSCRESIKSRKITIAQSAPVGYYRYTIYANFDVYAAVVSDIKNKTVRYEYISVPRENTFFDEFTYSEENDFADRYAQTRLEIDPNIFVNMGIDLFEENIEGKVPGFIYGEYRYVDGQDRKITDLGYYGLGHMYSGEAIDVSSLSSYFTDEYKFTFDVAIEYSAIKIAGFYLDGYKEAHLYNKISPPSDIEIDEIMAKERGWLGENIWGDDHGIERFTWEVSGSDCAEEMYIVYGAHGKGEDTWNKTNIIVNITVQKK